MKHSILSNVNKDEFEFSVDDNPDDCDPWLKMSAKLANPNLEIDGVNPQLNRKDSSMPEPQIKEVPTVRLDDDHHCTNHSSNGPVELLYKAGCRESEDFHSVSDRTLEGHATLANSNDDHKISPPCVEIRGSVLLGPLSGNSQNCSLILESPCSNAPGNFGVLAMDDRVHESSPSTPDFKLKENNAPSAIRDRCQSFGGLEMDVMDTIIVYTDYATYGDKYFPAALILFSRYSIELKTAPLEEEPVASSSVWKLDNIVKIDSQWTSLENVAKVRIQLLTDNEAHAGIPNETSGVVQVVEFVVPNWSQLQEQIMSLDVRYIALLSTGINMQSCNGDIVPLEDNETSSEPYIPIFEEPFEEVVYPKGDIDAVSVSKSDVDLLLPDVFVNDTVIDFYITYLKNEIPHERRRKFHFFSSFFFRKLADLDKNPSSISDGKAAFQRVRRWTRKVNIFEKDYILIPVNYNLHWSLLVVCHPGEVANFNEQNKNEASKVPCILHMDSIRGSHAGLKDLLQSYLLEEWNERQKGSCEDVSSKFLNLRFLSLELPQQENCSDCGLFLLHYAELFIEEAPQNFSPFRINNFDRFLKPDWFIPAEASLKRVRIQRLIFELLKSFSQESASPPRNSLFYSPALPVNKENDCGVEIVSEKRNLQISCSGSSFYSEADQGMDVNRHGMPVYRPSHCIESSILGVTALLEQQCQHLDRQASLGELGFCMSTISEVEGSEHLTQNSGEIELKPIDRVGEFQIGCSSDDVFQWNSDSSDQRDPDDALLSSSSRSCDNSTEEMRILECTGGVQSDSSCHNEKIDQSKEILDSQEGYASAPSDMMETPAEDTQELAEKYGSREQENPFLSNLEDGIEASQEELGKTEDEVFFSISSIDEKLVVENGKVEDDDREDPFLSISDGRFEASQEDLGKTEDKGIFSISSVDEKLVAENGKIENDDGEDPFLSISSDRFEASQEELGKTEDEGIVSISSVDEKLVVENGKIEDDDDQEDRFLSNSEDRFGASQEELDKTEDEGTVTLLSVDKKLVAEAAEADNIENDDHKGPLVSNSEDKVEPSQEEVGQTENEETVSLSTADDKLVVEETVAGADAWVTDSPLDPQRPAKRLRVSSSPSEVVQHV